MNCLFRGVRPGDIIVRAGSNFYFKGGETRKVTKIKLHKKYDQTRMYNDIALLKLFTPFKLSKNIGLIGLAKQIPKAGRSVIVSGYGLMSTNGILANYLMSVKLKYVNHKSCSNKYKIKLRGSMICAGIRGKDSCQGDSGGI